jgi:flavin reductase (DIM6/NTAB) family NADH-FMN oxidoreductase RutF
MRRATDCPLIHSYPGMVAMVTSRWNGRQNVMAAGWHSHISIEPPIYGVAVGKERFTHSLIQGSGVFAAHFLPAEKSHWIQQVGVASGHDMDKFAALGIEYQDGLTADVPILSDAYVAFECRVIDAQSYGDHDWFVGAITQFYRDDELFTENGLPDFRRLEIPLYLGRSEYAVLDGGARRKRHYHKEIWA